MITFSVFLKKHIYAFTLLTTIFTLQTVSAHESHLNRYVVSYLVANTNLAPHQDMRLINPWGLSISDNGDLYVADNGTNLVTSYEDNGSTKNFTIKALTLPSGLVHNTSKHHFKLPSTDHSAKFILSTENGSILAFNPKVDPLNAIIVADRSSFGTVYKGITIAKNDHQYFIYAADFFNAKIDMFDAHFNYLLSFTDPTIPSGFAPFNIQEINEKLYVTYAKQKGPDNYDSEPGPGNGFIDIFNLDGTFFGRLISNGVLNSPWGLTIGTHKFGLFSKALLVGNFGDGLINAFDPDSGAFLGHLNDQKGNPILLDGISSLEFRSHGSHLYFVSAPDHTTNGIVGVINYIDD